jgi:hypothetical protein
MQMGLEGTIIAWQSSLTFSAMVILANTLGFKFILISTTLLKIVANTNSYKRFISLLACTIYLGYCLETLTSYEQWMRLYGEL